MINELETAVRDRSDAVLQNGPAFELIVANQKDFARVQDEFEDKTRRMRS
jgi:hypothetical protein